MKYEISNFGNIKNKRLNHILSNKPRKDGYISFGLHSDNGKIKNYYIHILVAKTFLKNPENKKTVNHINNIRSDNKDTNLEWATYSEQNYKENKIPYKISGIPIYQCDLDGNIIKRWEKAIDAEKELNIDRRNILKVLKGERVKSGGFKWKYCEKEPNKDEELWKIVPLGEDYREVFVSSLGRIKVSEKRDANFGTLRESGYYQIKVFNIKEQKYKTFQVHRLICMAFNENPENKPFVNHIDENRGNNIPSNLNWMTNKENVNHSLNLNNRIKTNCRSKVILRIDKETNIIEEFSSIYQAAQKYNLNNQFIYHRCIQKVKQKEKDLVIWKYK